jgi:threonine synthase
MIFQSTRGTQHVSLDTALVQGLAQDGGLFLPQELPQFDTDDFTSAKTVAETAQILLRPFFSESALVADLDAITWETFRFPMPVTKLPVGDNYAGLLELYHGPTAAFKDVGAGFLAACLGRLQGDTDNPLTILVATSGDTGGAVAAAFNERPGMRVVVLYPDGRVSERQAHQLTCWGDNVLSLAVKGSFDDCQALVKCALADKKLSAKYRFSSANSINIGRLLPQCIYYAHSSLKHFGATGRKPCFIVPTGNLGNGLAAFLAKEMGLPIGDIVLATNENRLIPDYLQGAEWSPRASIQTLASAMDVGNPSNMERLRSLFGEAGEISQRTRAISVTDDVIRKEIRQNFDEFGLATCPHTATATFTWRQLDEPERTEKDWIMVATAHPAKFEQIVESITGEEVPLPAELADILSRPRSFVNIQPDAESLTQALSENFSD